MVCESDACARLNSFHQVAEFAPRLADGHNDFLRQQNFAYNFSGVNDSFR